MADNSLTNALEMLGTTIGTISTKVEASKTKVQAYKAKIITKLNEINKVIDNLKRSPRLTALPEFRQRLQASQAALQKKTEELDLTKGQLDDANRNLEQSQQNMTRINQELETVNQQLAELTAEKADLTTQKADLTTQKADLTTQKEAAERGLAAAREETSNIVGKIGVINDRLVQQIKFIDTIVNGLGDLDDVADDVAIQFKAVGDNIAAIMDMINSSDPDSISSRTRSKDKQSGGRKTMKKKHRKTRNLAKKNLKGGYVYSSSKDLDKASSIISASSKSILNSKSKSKSKSNSSKKAHKTKRRSKQ
jgi:chromosome segregation ATPase